LQFVPDLDFTRNLALKVQEQARDLTAELANLPSRYTEAPQVEVATGYARAASDAYRALLQRIDDALQRIGSRFHSPDAEIIAAVTAMLAELRAKGLF
jgi:colicin import membrane protein